MAQNNHQDKQYFIRWLSSSGRWHRVALIRTGTFPPCSVHFLLHIQWRVLQTNWWCGHGFSTLPCHSQLLHGGFREDSTRIRSTKTCVLVSLCRWHLRHLATRSWQTTILPTTYKQHPPLHSVHHENRDWWPSALSGHRNLQDTWRLTRAQSVPQAHPQQSVPPCHIPPSPIH
jgi:hypothetical protein